MTLFFKRSEKIYIGLDLPFLSEESINRLSWALGNAQYLGPVTIQGFFTGPRKEMITPWSTNAVEIAANMGIPGILRMEEFTRVKNEKAKFDPMLQELYTNLDDQVFRTDRQPEEVIFIEDISAYNDSEGLALSPEEIQYLENLSKNLGRKLTDSEVFGFSQVNSEHCRHKIFNGRFIIDGEEKESSLFELIKKTTRTNPNTIVSAYKDNCSFSRGPVIEQFAPLKQDRSDYFRILDRNSVLSLKAETHNFPTTVEPFNGASTGTGGEIRDRIGGGKGAFPMAGTAVYMTAFARSAEGRSWEKKSKPRPWLYQTPEQILIKASNGASDFGNKFGQPLICGSLLTYEYTGGEIKYGFDKVIMLAGGIGYGNLEESEKDIPEKGDLVILLGGDNYRIGMGGGAVSSVDTGQYANKIELNAVQRANPEMQKRVYNAIRALAESGFNSIVSIHDHGAGGHLNCLSELVEATGGVIDLSKLPVGDPTLSARELIGNESQERMGLIVKEKDLPELQKIAERERAPMYIIGRVTGDHRFVFEDPRNSVRPIDLELTDLFGNPPKTVMEDRKLEPGFPELRYESSKVYEYLEDLLQLEAVACKDWLTNKVDRSVTGKIAKQQCAGEYQLPLNNLGAVSLDYQGTTGYATSIGHAPSAGLVNPAAGSVLSIAEALTNLIWAPLEHGISGISLSANWMWPCRNPGQDAALYDAAKAASDFAIELGINIPTGKDSLSMTQKYGEEKVLSPGTVIISAAAQVSNIRQIVEPVAKNVSGSVIVYVDMSGKELSLGGSALSVLLNSPGIDSPDISDAGYFKKVFAHIQGSIKAGQILAGHDISAGGIITTLLEMCFSTEKTGMEIDLSPITDKDLVHVLFAENPGLILQFKKEKDLELLAKNSIRFYKIGKVSTSNELTLRFGKEKLSLNIPSLRDKWYYSSYLLDRKQSGEKLAKERFRNYHRQKLRFEFQDFPGKFKSYNIDPKRREESGIKTAIIREKGVNGDREMAWALYLSGMDVKDVHMTDLISGREDLNDVNMIVFVGGFSNSDVLGSAKGWAGAFRYNPTAKNTLDRFYQRKDTLSLGVCNGCQLMVELGLVHSVGGEKPLLIRNESGKFESAFLNVDIQPNHSIMLNSLSGYRLGIWVAHGEGRFSLPGKESDYHIPVKYSYEAYPGNPNGSDFSAAALCSEDGRHLAIMPHLERSFLPWQCGTYPETRKTDEITPWIEAFVNAREWIKDHKE